jgi:carbon-monoxide dehydrogenase large subunit
MPAVSLSVRGWYTNTTPTGPFRGAGQPEGTFVLERLIDAAARQLGMSPAELRGRNVLDAADFPYRSATGHQVDSGDAAALLRQAEAWLAVQPRDTKHGSLRCGAGLAMYMKVNGMGRQERAEIVISAGSDTVVARIGSQSNGQGHATTFGAIVAARLDLPPHAVRVVQGDTDQVLFGTGTGASSALATTGSGVARSATDLLCTARAVAARMLDAEPDALDYEAGSFHLPGTNRFATLRQLAADAGGELVGRSEVPVSLTFTLGCHACVVGVDLETGSVCVQRYAAFDDLGPLLQPAIAHGQLHGGIAQGVGQALLEVVRYDDTGQPITASLMDYCLPRASDLPNLHCCPAQTPSAASDLGVRGAGEAGAIASMAAVVNAAEAALGGTCRLEAPLTPLTVWRAIHSGADRHDHPVSVTLTRSHVDA